MSFAYHFHQQAPSSSGARSRRNPHRPSSSFKSLQMMRPKMEELTDGLPAVPTFVEKFEAGRSFDVEDDFAFIPELCTEEERVLCDSASDRSSTSSGSPQSSPLQHQVQPIQAYPHASTYNNMFAASNMQLKFQSGVPARQRNAIPIVNPTTGMRVASPPLASPSRVSSHSAFARRAVW